MARQRQTIGITLAALALLSAFSVTAKAGPEHTGAPSIRFATAIIPPYQQYDADGELAGYARPLIHCALDALGYHYSVDILPWARAQKNVELGKHDAFFVASKNAERDGYASLSAPVQWHPFLVSASGL